MTLNDPSLTHRNNLFLERGGLLDLPDELLGDNYDLTGQHEYDNTSTLSQNVYNHRLNEARGIVHQAAELLRATPQTQQDDQPTDSEVFRASMFGYTRSTAGARQLIAGYLTNDDEYEYYSDDEPVTDSPGRAQQYWARTTKQSAHSPPSPPTKAKMMSKQPSAQPTQQPPRSPIKQPARIQRQNAKKVRQTNSRNLVTDGW